MCLALSYCGKGLCDSGFDCLQIRIKYHLKLKFNGLTTSKLHPFLSLCVCLAKKLDLVLIKSEQLNISFKFLFLFCIPQGFMPLTGLVLG